METINGEKKVGIPESITLNGVTYTVKDTPELLQFIQEVSKVEKSKLYTQFDNLKAQIANLGKVKVSENAGLDVDSIVERLKGTFITKEDFQEMLPGTLREVVQPMLTATEQNRKNELAEYRERIISANSATCIPDLVKGDTKEELDASLAESIRIRASYPTPSTVNIDPTKHTTDPLIQKQAQEMAVEQTQTPTPTATAPSPSSLPPMPVAPRRTSPEVSGPQNVKQMPMSEFERQRDALKQQLEAMYSGGSL